MLIFFGFVVAGLLPWTGEARIGTNKAFNSTRADDHFNPIGPPTASYKRTQPAAAAPWRKLRPSNAPQSTVPHQYLVQLQASHEGEIQSASAQANRLLQAVKIALNQTNLLLFQAADATIAAKTNAADWVEIHHVYQHVYYGAALQLVPPVGLSSQGEQVLEATLLQTLDDNDDVVAIFRVCSCYSLNGSIRQFNTYNQLIFSFVFLQPLQDEQVQADDIAMNVFQKKQADQSSGGSSSSSSSSAVWSSPYPNVPTSVQETASSDSEELERIQLLPPRILWSLDRIDQPRLPLDGRYRFFSPIPEATTNQTNMPAARPRTQVYVLDTGILASHWEFRALPDVTTFRARCGFSVYDDCLDKSGHGTVSLCYAISCLCY